MKDYTSKTVYIGIDVHKKTYAVTAICENEIVKRDTLAAYPERLVNYLKKYFKGAQVHSAYEAGFSGFGLHRLLIENGIKNIVVHAASIKVSARDRVKTDKRDSLKIATELSHAQLKSIKVPDLRRENFRALTRTRDSFAEDKKRIGNKLKSFLMYHGLMGPKDIAKISQYWIKQIKELEVDETLKYCIETYADEWLHLNERLKTIDKKISEQAQQDQDIDHVYRSVPGIGALSARILANELEDMKHFSNEKGLFSYTGLTPTEHSSGEHRRLGNISRQGKSLLRKILVQAAWVAIRHDKHLEQVYQRIRAQSGAKKAIVAIARRMIGCIRSCFMNNQDWCARALDAAGNLQLLQEACVGGQKS